MPEQPKKKQPEQPKKPLGPVLDWTDEDLDALSLITEADLKAADALWKAEAPPKLKNLLQAEVQEEKQ